MTTESAELDAATRAVLDVTDDMLAAQHARLSADLEQLGETALEWKRRAERAEAALSARAPDGGLGDDEYKRGRRDCASDMSDRIESLEAQLEAAEKDRARLVAEKERLKEEADRLLEQLVSVRAVRDSWFTTAEREGKRANKAEADRARLVAEKEAAERRAYKAEGACTEWAATLARLPRDQPARVGEAKEPPWPECVTVTLSDGSSWTMHNREPAPQPDAPSDREREREAIARIVMSFVEPRRRLIDGEWFVPQSRAVEAAYEAVERAALAHAPAPAVAVPGELSVAARDVLAERRRQVEVEGWTPEHDDTHDKGEMGSAAINYAAAAILTLRMGGRAFATEPPFSNWLGGVDWPWDREWWKPSTPRRDLVKAGALILAEIERLDRIAPEARS